MPRKSRIDAAGALHHVMVRGIEKGELYPEVEALIKELIQNNTLEQVKSEISQEDYELIKKDIEFIREKLKI